MPNINFELHKIFVEGNTDQACIEKILKLKYDISFPVNGIALKDGIISCDGWTNIGNQPSLLDKFRIENGGKNLVIFDADRNNNEGGFQKRLAQLHGIANVIGVCFDIYLFPNNEEDGVLEDFYCSCFKDEMKFFENCWQGMLNCFEASRGQDLILKYPHINGKVFSYVDLFEKYKTGNYKNTKGKRSYFDDGLWNFDFDTNNNLKSLISFIENTGIVA